MIFRVEFCTKEWPLTRVFVTPRVQRYSAFEKLGLSSLECLLIVAVGGSKYTSGVFFHSSRRVACRVNRSLLVHDNPTLRRGNYARQFLSRSNVLVTISLFILFEAQNPLKVGATSQRDVTTKNKTQT